MEKSIRVNYPHVYEKINELRLIVTEDIVQKSQITHSDTSSMLSGMSGKANLSFRTADDVSDVRARTVANALTNILDFIEAATKNLERHDEELASEIMEEG